MIKITPAPEVLQALTAAFPKPASAAAKALIKYVAALEQLILQASLLPRNPEQLKFGLYSISLHRLANTGGRIGSNKQRVHKWLQDNQLELIKTVTQGSNLTGKLSEVAFTKLASATHMPSASQNPLGDAAALAATDFENPTPDQLLNLFNHLYPDFHADMNVEELDAKYDILDVDEKSLRNYIYWLENEAALISKVKVSHALQQARLILAISEFTEARFPQRKKPSEFGRMYYHGVSIQNVNRQLRSAVLGNCWEYDIRSSVVCWKMGFAENLIKTNAPTKQVSSVFASTLYYIQNKKQMMAVVAADVFQSGTSTPKQIQEIILKQAFTAICFGARAISTGWKDATGQWRNPALSEILKNQNERKIFLKHHLVKAFLSEQNLLDLFIFQRVTNINPSLLTNRALCTASGKPSRPRILAYLYQHAETDVMNIVRSTAGRFKLQPIANVHDAIFFKKKLSENQLDTIVFEVRHQTHNQYWALAEKKIEAWLVSDRQLKAAIKSQQEHMLMEDFFETDLFNNANYID